MIIALLLIGIIASLSYSIFHIVRERAIDRERIDARVDAIHRMYPCPRDDSVMTTDEAWELFKAKADAGHYG